MRSPADLPDSWLGLAPISTIVWTEWLRTGDGRQALLNPRWRSVGSDVRVDVAGVAIVLLLAPE